ncbi:MAG: hydrogen gas-evolving membrane-bound hydrogenase subunit E [Candidatus Nezhaarchaeales archaeon]
MNVREALALTFIAVLGLTLAYGVVGLPSFGFIRPLALYYLNNTLTQTAATEAVQALVWDYRGYDTLGETSVFFIAVIGVLTLLSRRRFS